MWLFSIFTGGTIGRWLAIIGISGMVLVAAAGGGVLYGWASCKNAAEVRYLKEANRWLNEELSRRDARTHADNSQRERDRTELDRLDDQIRDLTDELQTMDRECLSADTVERLQRGWGR